MVIFYSMTPMTPLELFLFIPLRATPSSFIQKFVAIQIQKFQKFKFHSKVCCEPNVFNFRDILFPRNAAFTSPGLPDGIFAFQK
jgi:hypothetical protein